MIIRTVAKFEAAHRQLGDESKCGFLHGHNWKVEFLIEGDITGDVGYIIDFKIVKTLVNAYDHVVLLHKDDPLVRILLINGQKVVDLDVNPTAENLAQLLKDRLQDMMVINDIVYRRVLVRVWENNESYAEVGSL